MLNFGKYRVDGSSSERVIEDEKEFARWRVFDSEGNFLSGFYGPASFSAACAFATHLDSLVPGRIIPGRARRVGVR